MQWRDSLAGVLGGFADVLAKRSTEKERETLHAGQAWQQAATSLALALMSGADISACNCPTHMGTCNCELPSQAEIFHRSSPKAIAPCALIKVCICTYAEHRTSTQLCPSLSMHYLDLVSRGAQTSQPSHGGAAVPYCSECRQRKSW